MYVHTCGCRGLYATLYSETFKLEIICHANLIYCLRDTCVVRFRIYLQILHLENALISCYPCRYL